MKKITLLLVIMFSLSAFSQEKKFIRKTQQPLTSEQSSFIASINKYYPEFELTKSIVNIYDDKGDIAESYLEYSSAPNQCDDYVITVHSDNKQLDYEFDYSGGNGNGIFRGTIYVVGSDVYKTEVSTKGSKNNLQLYKNGKNVFSSVR